jgi:hypothetical protein
VYLEHCAQAASAAEHGAADQVDVEELVPVGGRQRIGGDGHVRAAQLVRLLAGGGDVEPQQRPLGSALASHDHGVAVAQPNGRPGIQRHHAAVADQVHEAVQAVAPAHGADHDPGRAPAGVRQRSRHARAARRAPRWP